MALLIHHLHVSQSERILWLCEELGIPYTVKYYDRAPLLAPAEYKALHPQGTSPVIQHEGITLAESGACVEYICNRLASPEQRDALTVKPDAPEYAQFLYWWHWVNGSFQPALGRSMAARAMAGVQNDDNPMQVMARDRLKRGLNGLNDRLADNEWLAGDQFSLADIMAVFPLTTMRYFFPYDLGEYGNIVRYLQRVAKREAYQRAMKKGDPEMELVLGPDPPAKTLM